MSTGDPVLYVSNPPGFPADARRRMLDDVARLNQKKLEDFADPEIHTRIQQYELAYRMQTSVPVQLPGQCRDVDQASAALVLDLKQRGLLDDTLVLWGGGEFGRTSYCQGALTAHTYGRDHHPRCFSIWAAGGGVKAGHVHGATDDFSYDVVGDSGVHGHIVRGLLN